MRVVIGKREKERGREGERERGREGEILIVCMCMYVLAEDDAG